MLSVLELVILSSVALGGLTAQEAPRPTGTIAITSSDVCPDSFEGGVGEPRFCRIQEPARVTTPFFSVDIAPELLVGIDSGGRRLIMQPTLWQSPVALSIRAVESAETVSDRRAGWDCQSIDLADSDGVICNRNGSQGGVLRRYVLRRGANVLEIYLSVSSLGQPLLPVVDAIIRSLEVAAL